MRALLISAAVLVVASCSSPRPPGADSNLQPPGMNQRPNTAAAPGTPVPLAPAAPATATSPPPPTRTAAVPPPPPPPPAPAVAANGPPAPTPTSWIGSFMETFGPQHPGPSRLTLSNFQYDHARVEVVVTAARDCAAHGPGVLAQSEFDLAYNGTRVVQAPPGADVCWRHDLAADHGPGGVPKWSGWSRAFLAAGQSVDSRL